MAIKTCKMCGSVLGAARPVHTHVCTGGDEVHTWNCDSPYCSAKERDCVDHGGVPARSTEEGI